MAPARQRLRDPVLWTDASQILKTVAAAVVAWVIAKDALDVAQPFLAPWAALLTVHATVYKTFSRGAQQVGATVLGVVFAFLAGTLLGVNAGSLAVMLLAGMVAGITRGLRAESTTAAATALVVLLTGYSEDSGMLVARLLDTVIGIGVGLVVNLLVWPPLHDRSAARRVDVIDDRLGELLSDIAACEREGRQEVDEWVERTRELDHEIDDAWATLRQARESGRLNPRRSARRRMKAAGEFASVLSRLEQAVAEARSMARTLGNSAAPVEWNPDFRDNWLDLLARTGAAISAADTGGLERATHDIEESGRALSHAGDGSLTHCEHGALLVNLRNIAEAMHYVAGAQPVRPRASEPKDVRRPMSVP